MPVAKKLVRTTMLENLLVSPNEAADGVVVVVGDLSKDSRFMNSSIVRLLACAFVVLYSW